MATPVQQNLEQKNSQYASNFTKSDLPLPPAKHYAVVTCMDARIHAPDAFGIDLGDAHIIRNGGGNARDALRSILISQHLLHTREVLLIKHTDCGMLTFKNEEAHEVLKKNLGESKAATVQGFDFQPFQDLESAVKDDVSFLKNHEAIPQDIKVSGWIYDVKTGKVSKVV